jgi:REase_AHJR-like
MTSSLGTLERDALDQVERRLVDQGYTVVREPEGAALPNFMGRFQPDAIATGRLPQLVIEVIARRGPANVDAARIEQLRRLIGDHPDWALEVIYAAPTSPNPEISAPEAIRQRLSEIRRLATIDPRATLTMAWSMLEAAARALLPDRADRPLTPASTIELLASLGYIEASQAERLRIVGRARNLIVHGDLNQQIAAEDLDAILDIIEALVGVLDRRTSQME